MPERLGESDFGFHVTGDASEEQLKALMDLQFCGTSQLFPICSRAPFSTLALTFGGSPAWYVTGRGICLDSRLNISSKEKVL